MAREAALAPLDFDAAVLDSSVVVKWFTEGEFHRPQALHLRQAYVEGKLRLAVPDLLFYEIANVLRYKPGMEPVQVQAAVQSLFDMGLERVTLSEKLIARSVELAYEHQMPVHDAVFLACAQTLGAVLVSADEKFVRKMPQPAKVRLLSSLRLAACFEAPIGQGL